MDPQVLDAVARWPNVPAVHGWLSLDGRGRFKLHPQGDAGNHTAGESISNTQILGFMARNYAHDDAGRWYFQNGPQRVYVRVDGAPLILRGADEGDALVAHTGAAIARIDAWWLDDAGALYAATDVGPGMVEDRDLPAVLETLALPDGSPALDRIAALKTGEHLTVSAFGSTTRLTALARGDIPQAMGFVASPAGDSA